MRKIVSVSEFSRLLPVTRDEFFSRMNYLNVHPLPISSFPYVSEWRMIHSRRLIGISFGNTFFLTFE